MAGAHTSFWRRHAGKLIASVIIAAGLVYMLQSGGLKIWPEGVSFRGIRWWPVPIYLVIVATMNFFRATRWRFLLRAVAAIPLRRIVAVSWIGFAAILVMPFRIGEFVRPYMIRSPSRTEGDKTIREVSMSTATGSVVAERIVDGLYLSIVLAIALVFVPTIQPLPKTVVGLRISVEQVRAAGFGMLGLFIVLFITIAVFYFARGWAHHTTLAVFGAISRPLGERLAGIAEKVADGLHFFGRARDAIPFFFETTIYWALNALGMWLLGWACHVVHADGSSITFPESCALMGMLGATLLIPGPPGLLGIFQAGVYAGMTMYYPTDVVTGCGAAYVFLLYGIQVLWTILAAAGFLFVDRGTLHELEQAEEADEEEDDRKLAQTAPLR
jgi:hypothetical protein